MYTTPPSQKKIFSRRINPILGASNRLLHPGVELSTSEVTARDVDFTIGSEIIHLRHRDLGGCMYKGTLYRSLLFLAQASSAGEQSDYSSSETPDRYRKLQYGHTPACSEIVTTPVHLLLISSILCPCHPLGQSHGEKLLVLSAFLP